MWEIAQVANARLRPPTRATMQIARPGDGRSEAKDTHNLLSRRVGLDRIIVP
jgi:hypothetical protein